MPLNRHGDFIHLGWPEHHLIYLRAASTLKGEERFSALFVISEMTGRSYNACLLRMNRLIAEDRQKARDVARRVFVTTPTVSGHKLRLPPSAFAVSLAARMDGSGRTVKARAAEGNSLESI